VSSATMHDDAVLEEPHRMEKLVAEAAEALADAPAEEIIRWATDTFGDRICITSSMTDAVIVHLASQIKPGIDVVFLDTGYHFPETIGTRDAVEAVYPIKLINITPSRTVAEQDAEYGPDLYARDPDLCCQLRKVEPLNEALAVGTQIRGSAQKLNLVAQLIRGKKVATALADLEFSRKRIAKDVRKCLESAIANAENNHDLDVDDLVVAEASVGKALVIKRHAARARGRVGAIFKPFANLTIVVREVEAQA